MKNSFKSIGLEGSYEKARVWSWRLWIKFSHLVVLFFLRVLNRTRALGLEHIPPGGGVLFVSNHISAVDVLAIPAFIMARQPGEVVRTVAKEELFKIPLLGRVLKSWLAVPVGRTGRDIGSMRRVADLIAGEKVVLYPEGTRSPDGRLGPGRRAVGWIIWKARPLVIPTAVVGTNHILPKGALLPRLFQRAEVRFGEPLELEAYYSMEGGRETSHLITQRVMEAIAGLIGERAGPPCREEAAKV